MSAASSPNPNNMILLAVLGIGAYWLFSRQAVAATYARPVATNNQNKAANGASLINAGANLISSLFGGKSAAPSVNTAYYTGQLTPTQYSAAQTAAQSDSNPDLNGSVADWMSNDGAAYNPPGNVSAYDQWVENVYYN